MAEKKTCKVSMGAGYAGPAVLIVGLPGGGRRRMDRDAPADSADSPSFTASLSDREVRGYREYGLTVSELLKTKKSKKKGDKEG